MTQRQTAWQTYFFAAGVTAAALLIRFTFSASLGGHAPFLPLIAAIVLAAWLGGLGPGLLATALGGAAGALIPPHLYGVPSGAGSLLHLGIFFGIGALISWVSESLHAARRRLAVSEQKLAHRFQELQAILETTPAVVYLIDHENRFIHINRRWEEVFGLTNERVAGRSIDDFFPPASANQFRENNQKVLAARSALEFEEVVSQSDGPHTYITVKVPLFDSSGEPYAICGVSTDITERKRAEREKEQALRTLSSLISSAPVGIALLDAEMRFVLVNQPLAEMNGLSAGEHTGRNLAEIVPDLVSSVGPMFRHVLETGEPVKDKLIEGETAKAPGDRRAWIESWFPVYDSRDGTPSHVGVVVQEVTDRLRAERQLRESQEALKEADRKKDEFLATLSHELRNPLAPLRHGLELLRLAAAGREIPAERTLRMMDRQLTQMVRLVDDLLELSRITTGRLKLRKEWIDLESVVRAAVETSQPLIEESHHNLTVDLPPTRIVVHADKTRLAQVLSNLLTNAAKYTEPGGEIRLKAEQQDDAVVISVQDSGLGIPAGMLARIFEMFTQVQRSVERSQGGLGIGLTLAKRLVDLHGGSIEARSEGEGKGSTFTIRLPTNPGPTSEQMREDLESVRGRLPNHRIVVADDNEDSAESLALLLELKGHQVRTARNGLEAIEIAEALRPQVILLDIGMPKLNGYDAARRIRELPWGKDIVLIALTGWGQAEDVRLAMASGFNHHLVKPVDLATLDTLLAESPQVAR